jgi:hypothetical protein
MWYRILGSQYGDFQLLFFNFTFTESCFTLCPASGIATKVKK